MIFLLLFFWSSVKAASYSCAPQFDELGIPHIKTRSQEEFYFCFGKMHGTDRAWEMDYFRRIAQGRNSEVLGYTHLKSDLMMRFLNIEEKRDSLWKTFPEKYKKYLEAYADGANEGFVTGKKAKEFLDQGFEPEPWKAEDSLLVLLIQSFDQTRKAFYRDYEEEKDKETWGHKAVRLFDEDHLPWENNILKLGEYPVAPVSEKTTTSIHHQLKLWASFPTIFGEETGSNNWVISKKKSTTGSAILANDPHLDLKTPLFWYWIHLQSPEGEVIGGSVPGVPVVASGTNGKVAWGLTNAYINTADAIFISDLKKDDIVSVRPWVKFKFGPFTLPFFFKTFELTKSGLRILPLEIESQYKMALRWTGFALDAEDVTPMFEMMNTKDVTEMNEVLSRTKVPAWNYVFADRSGDVGFRVVGKAYRHTKKLPYGIPLMTLNQIENPEYLAPEEIPHVIKPARQYVYTANNRHWAPDSAFYGGRAYSQSFRGFRIDELLQGPQDARSFKTIQCDRQVVDARFFLPLILKAIKVQEFKGWQLTSDDHSSALPLYRRFMDIMMESWKVNETALYHLLLKPGNVQVKEMKSFLKMARKDVKDKKWGDFHRLGFIHQSKNPEWVFAPEISGPGDNHSVDPGTAKWNADRKVYEQTSGASMRMIIEMKERPVIELALPGLNRNYTEKSSANPWESWKACRYSRVSF